MEESEAVLSVCLQEITEKTSYGSRSVLGGIGGLEGLVAEVPDIPALFLLDPDYPDSQHSW